MPINKPTILPRWATGAAVITEPTVAEKDVGFVPGTPASAAYTNWLLNQLYQWIQFLNDPATLTAGGLTISGGTISTPSLAASGNATVGGTLGVTGATTVGGTLGVTGNTTVGGTLGVTGALTAGGLTLPAGKNATVGGTLGVTGATTLGSTLGVTGNTTVGGTLGVTGATTLGSTLGVTSNATVGGTLGVTGAVTATGGLTAGANQHVTVSGTGEYKHGDRTLQLPASAGTPVNVSDGMSGWPATSATGWKYARSIGGQAQFWYGPVSAQEVEFPITLKVGDRIKSVSARIQDSTGAGNNITMYLHKSVASSSFTTGSGQIGTTQTSAANGTIQTLTLSGLSQTILSFEMYNVTLRANGSTLSAHRILGVQVTYDRP